jgi:glycosyltransferase involved in cell wall biosynthesis
MYQYWKRFRALRAFILTYRPDVIVSFLSHVNVAALLASARLKLPVIVSERNHPPKLKLPVTLSTMRRLLYPKASRVVMLSKQGLEWLTTSIPTAKGTIIPNPVNLPLPRTEPIVDPSARIESTCRLLMATGRLDHQKGFDVLLRAFARVANHHPAWRLVIIGEGPLRSPLEAELARLGLIGRVLMPGRVGNMSDWYERADVFVLSSRFEGFPNTLTEALAHGCPAVSFDCDTGPREILRDGIDGLLVRPIGDETALAAAMDRLMADDKLREDMGNAARDVANRYSKGAILQRWDQLFDEVMN